MPGSQQILLMSKYFCYCATYLWLKDDSEGPELHKHLSFNNGSIMAEDWEFSISFK